MIVTNNNNAEDMGTCPKDSRIYPIIIGPKRTLDPVQYTVSTVAFESFNLVSRSGLEAGVRATLDWDSLSERTLFAYLTEVTLFGMTDYSIRGE